jgi:hypothetical protein
MNPKFQMLLFHGTSTLGLPKILKQGLKPRRGNKSNWELAESRPDMVYLTTVYPLYFAACCIEKRGRLAVVEIDVSKLDDKNFYPDEDFIAQAIARQEHKSLMEIHAEIKNDLEGYQQYWNLSLTTMGICCHRGPITPDHFTRYAVIDQHKRPALVFDMMSPSITSVNYRLRAEYYRNFIKWVMGDLEELPQLIEIKTNRTWLPKQMKIKALDHWEKESASREGIEVFKL